MRFVKAAVLVGLFCFCLGVFLLLMEGNADPADQPQFEKPAIWGGDILVHQGNISRHSRNGYSADYDDLWNYIYAAVTCYSSGPDTCYLYASLTGASGWITNWPYHYVSEYGSDLCNPQVVKGEGSHPQEYYFLLDRLYGDIILYRRAGMAVDTFYLSDGNESFSATRDDPSDQNYRLHMARATNLGEVVYSYSTNYGQNWQTRDTVDGDMPHIATAGLEGDAVYLTWRLDGEDGAFYGVRSLYERVAKNPTPGSGTWKYYPPFDTSAIDGCPMNLFQASDGSIYVGVDTGPDIFVQKSQDGGETWTSTDDLGSQEDIGDFLETGEAIYVATGRDIILRGAKVYKTTDGGTNWNNTGDIGEITDDWAICLARSSATIYVGTSPEGDVFKSTNAGTDWTECGELNGADAINDIIVTQSGTIIAAGEGGDSLGFFRSTNGGDSWFCVEPPGLPLRVRCVLQASDGTVLAGVDKAATEDPGIMKSTNDGVTWTWTSFNPPGYFIKFIMEASNSYLYTSDGIHVYRSINHGDTWTVCSGSPGLEDMIQSKHQIAVKKSTNRGVTWQSAHIVSDPDDSEYSDPKVAGTQGTSSYKVWVAHSAAIYTNDWAVRYYYSTDQGASWQGSYLLTVPRETLPICDLAVKRGDSSYVHAAFMAEIGGSRDIRYARSHPGNPTNWSIQSDVPDIRPTLAHAPEISFYQDNPVVFFSWGFGIPTEYPKNLYVDAQHFTDVEEEEEGESQIRHFSLSQNYPNPFNPVTRIQYSVYSRQTAAHTTVRIYNIQGQLVRTLVDQPKQAGSYQVVWDGKNQSGKDVGSGIYFCKLKVGDNSQTKKMVLIK